MEEEIRILINCQHSFQIQLFKVICFPGFQKDEFPKDKYFFVKKLTSEFC